jgi:sigma-B regulation protein RsbU (phosphoserine phosphatase)
MNLAPNFFDTKSRNWRARLAISVEVMRELSRYSDPQEMYHVFARRMGQLFPTSRQLTLSRRGLDRPDFRVTRFNLWKEALNPWTHWDRFPVRTGGLFADLLYADEPRLVGDLRVPHGDPAGEFLDGQRSALSIPIYENGAAVNAVVLTREEPDAFPPEQVPELVWMSNLFGRAAQTMVLTQALREAYEAADGELRAVADVQQSLLPAGVPTVPGLDVAVHYRTACRAGGDYYDFFPLPGWRLGVLVADVSGHGTHAAVLMAITHSIAHAAPVPPSRPGAFLTHLNRTLSGRYSRQAGAFVTAFYAVLDPTKNSLTYATAGHVPPRLVRGGDGALVLLNRAQRLPLGVAPADADYPEQAVEFTPGDQVVLLTDGVTEAVNRPGEMFGTDRLDAVLGAGARTADDRLRGVLAELEAFTRSSAPADDRTLVVVRRTDNT